MSIHVYDDRKLRRAAGLAPSLAWPERRRRPAPQRRRGSGGLILGAFLLSLLGLAILVALNMPEAAPKIAAVKPVAVPASPWIDIVRPIKLFDLTAPELAKAPLAYAARRHISGGRQDLLTFGSLDGSAYMRLQLYRVGKEVAPAAPLYVDLARAAAQGDLSITRSLPPSQLATRFGTFEVADLSLAGKAVAPVPCLGFRGAALDGKFQILGFACGSKSLTLSRPTLGCLIDRLDLIEAGDDRELANFFAATELKRNPACAGGELRPTVHHASWLDRNDAPPPLQGKKPL